MTIDTNILTAHSLGDVKVAEAIIQWRKQATVLFVSTVAESEFLAYPKFSEIEVVKGQTFIAENFNIIDFNSQQAALAARIRRHKKMKFPDSAIAATALYTRTPLVTRNAKDFKNIPNLKIISL